MTVKGGGGDVVVLDVWFDELKGVGQTAMKHSGRVSRAALRRAAVSAARAELSERFPVDVSMPVVGGRLFRGPRLPDGQKHAFVDWRLGYPAAKLRHTVEHLVVRGWAVLTGKRGS